MDINQAPVSKEKKGLSNEPLSNNSQIVTNPLPLPPRASKRRALFDNNEPKKALVRLSCINCNYPSSNLLVPLEIWNRILFYSDFKSILVLRLISKVSWLASLASKQLPYKPLPEKAAVRINNTSTSYLDKQKLDFAKQENIDVHILFNFNDPVNSFLQFDLIPDDKRKMILQIKNIEQVNTLYTILTKLSQQLDKEFFKKIQKLDFKEFKIDVQTPNASDLIRAVGNLLTAIANNLKIFPNLTSLYLQYDQSVLADRDTSLLPLLNQLTTLTIGRYGIITWPDSMDNLTQLTILTLKQAPLLPNSLKNLKVLKIGTIYIPWCLPNSLSNLKKLEFWNVQGSDILVTFPHNSNLKNLGFGRVACSSLSFNSLPNLKELMIGTLVNKASVRFPDGLPITKLGIGFMGEATTLKLPVALNKLMDLTIGGMHDQLTFRLRSIDYGNAYVQFPNTFPNLKTLTFLYLDDLMAQQMPSSLPTVSHLVIESIQTQSIGMREIEDILRVELRTSFDNIEYLIIPPIELESVKLSGSFLNLISLTIQKLHYKSTLRFTKAFPNLKILNIESMEKDTNLQLPFALPNLTTLILGEISYSANIKIPRALNKLTTLILGKTNTSLDRIHFDKIQFPDSLPNLVSLSIGKYQANLASLNNRKFFAISSQSQEDAKTISTILDTINTLINRPPSPEVTEETCSLL